MPIEPMSDADRRAIAEVEAQRCARILQEAGLLPLAAMAREEAIAIIQMAILRGNHRIASPMPIEPMSDADRRAIAEVEAQRCARILQEAGMLPLPVMAREEAIAIIQMAILRGNHRIASAT